MPIHASPELFRVTQLRRGDGMETWPTKGWEEEGKKWAGPWGYYQRWREGTKGASTVAGRVRKEGETRGRKAKRVL
jgi:hypothetical protein